MQINRGLFSIVVFLILALASISNAVPETNIEFLKRVTENREVIKSDDAIVYWGGVAAPIGRFLLIRKDTETCAVLFKNFRRGGDAKPGTAFNTGEERLYADYDWYLQNDGSGDFGKENIKQGHDKVAYGPLVGIGRLAFQTTNQRISCGTIKLYWTYPDIVRFLSGSKVINAGIELAPTPWSNISEVNAGDSDVKWFQMDQNRMTTIIPVSDLKK